HTHTLYTHNTTHMRFGGDTGHTHTHMLMRSPVKFAFCLQPILETLSFLKGSGQPFFRRPGTRPSVQSNLGQGRTGSDLFCSCVGVLCGGNPCEHGENMQTPHRKAREIAHLSTGGLGRTCKLHTERPGR